MTQKKGINLGRINPVNWSDNTLIAIAFLFLVLFLIVNIQQNPLKVQENIIKNHTEANYTKVTFEDRMDQIKGAMANAGYYIWPSNPTGGFFVIVIIIIALIVTRERIRAFFMNLFKRRSRR